METRKPKRSRFSQKHRSDGQKLAQALRFHRKEFPRYAPQLDQLIARIVAESERTRAGDRQRVLQCLREWPGGLGFSEIMEDTGMSRWDTKQVLYSLIAEGVIEVRREALPGAGRGSRGACERKLFSLKD